MRFDECWKYMIDCVYIAASKLDARFTRICVASVRYFHSEIPIRLLVGGCLARGLADELRRYWGVRIADIPKGDHGWGFVKLEPLFAPPGERFLVLDSDTVMAGPVLELANYHDEDLIVDNENVSPEVAKAVYYDFEKAAEEGIPVPGPAFLFNTGQWFGRSGILSRADFGDLVQWGFPPRVTNPRIFKNGEQGVLNFVANELLRLGRLRVARVPLMRWPGHGMQGLEANTFLQRAATPIVVHWAGMKRVRQRNMVGADLLAYFEDIYYQRFPFGRARRIVSNCQNALTHCLDGIRVRARLAFRKLANPPLAKVHLRVN
jgi:hypothetical protein